MSQALIEPITEDVKARRRLSVSNAIASAQLEGQCPNPECTKDLNAWAEGEIDMQEVKRRAFKRLGINERL